ncbi:hypothetical protein BAQU_0199 [Bifidobacterium aquikefiri]|uniref:Uncharacterized protein n=1 Tax=Bifidobacterium aquikefiri TaxID=1653207 RepID=A0A261GAC8_9BIFI|nr:hypothetical protein BAQU_0199 [Bifidobacterium aquikefiri]
MSMPAIPTSLVIPIIPSESTALVTLTCLVTPSESASLVISSERSESRDLILASINSQDPSTRCARSG